MVRSEDEALIRGSAERLYGKGQAIWDPADEWNVRKRGAIDAFAKCHATALLARSQTILDAGCGSQPYDWMPARAVGLDRFWMQVAGRPNAVAGDLTRLPLASASMDTVVCVASVLNYVSAAEGIGEMARVTRQGGHLLLHFETSSSFDHLGTPRWRRSAARLETLNGGRTDTIWVYRPAYIRALLAANGFRIVREQRFHILSALGLRLGLSQQNAARLAALDPGLGLASAFADDVILLAEKHA